MIEYLLGLVRQAEPPRPQHWQPGIRLIANDMEGAKDLNGVIGSNVVNYEGEKGRTFANDFPANCLSQRI